jgi:hypothetical protein
MISYCIPSNARVTPVQLVKLRSQTLLNCRVEKEFVEHPFSPTRANSPPTEQTRLKSIQTHSYLSLVLLYRIVAHHPLLLVVYEV